MKVFNEQALDVQDIRTAKQAKQAGLRVKWTRGRGKNSGSWYYRIYPGERVIKYHDIHRQAWNHYVLGPFPGGSPIDWSAAEHWGKSEGQETKELQATIDHICDEDTELTDQVVAKYSDVRDRVNNNFRA